MATDYQGRDCVMIKYLFMDVDGTLTDGKINIAKEGELYKSFDVKDGYAIANILPKIGITPVIVTGRNSSIVEQRARELNVSELYQGIKDKYSFIKNYLFENEIGEEECGYIGDDINDFLTMKHIKKNGGILACPLDACDDIKDIVTYISQRKGGDGAVRDIIEYLITVKYESISALSSEAYSFARNAIIYGVDIGRFSIKNEMYANIEEYITHCRKDRKYEQHHRYIDIQIVLAGSEVIEVLQDTELEVNQKYDKARDIIFYNGEPRGKKIYLSKGDYCILYPEDIHMPCIQAFDEPEYVKKMVIKVPILDEL